MSGTQPAYNYNKQAKLTKLMRIIMFQYSSTDLCGRWSRN